DMDDLNYHILLSRCSSAVVNVDGVDMALENNSLLFLNPGSKFKVNEVEDEPILLEFNKQFYCVEIHDEEVSCNGLLFNGYPALPVLQLQETTLLKLEALHKVMVDELTEDDIQLDMIKLLLKRWIILCTRDVKKQIGHDHDLDDQHIDVIREFSALVEKHFKTKHKVQDYADMLFKSPKTLSNVFHQYGNKSPKAIIHERIILEAKRQFHYTDHSVKEVAFELGFEDPGSFSRFFKKHTGMTVSEFKLV
ncbi:MAG: AraC family transcriptional regulator, partial [Flavobacteriales bacterium]|nr:AraC family transcriptional regulator [Flavobacteriales bacterium]